MQRELRRKDRALESAQTRELLESGEYGVLATCGAHGQPYGVPVNYAVMDDAIYIHSAVAGHKLENIRANPRVSFSVVGRTELLPEEFGTRYESVVATGHAQIVQDPVLRRAALRALVAKYAAEHVKAGEAYIDALFDKVSVIRVSLDRITGKARR